MGTPREDQLDSEWRGHLQSSMDRIEVRMSDLIKENAEQHGDLKADVAELRERVEHAFKILSEAEKKIEGKDRTIRVLVYVLCMAIGIIGGVKAHALGIVKDLLP